MRQGTQHPRSTHGESEALIQGSPPWSRESGREARTSRPRTELCLSHLHLPHQEGQTASLLGLARGPGSFADMLTGNDGAVMGPMLPGSEWLGHQWP